MTSLARNAQQTQPQTRLDAAQQQPNGRRVDSREVDGSENHRQADEERNDSSNLVELVNISPVRNPHEGPQCQQQFLEDARDPFQESNRPNGNNSSKSSSKATQIYTMSYLIFFSCLGTLARLGLQALTFYPGSPVIFSELWANFGGCLFMGFFIEDRKLFREEWGVPIYHQALERAKLGIQTEQDVSGHVDIAAAKQAHNGTKKTIPLYIGLTTGFCGCFTSFSSFIRDAFLALSNALPPLDHNAVVARNGGYSFMAFLAVIIATVAICMGGLFVGAHIAIATEPFVPSIPFKFGRKWMDPIIVFVSFGCWLGAVLLAIFPPDRDNAASEIWRGRAVLALVFAPLGCLGRFYLSSWLNGKIPSFPVGTFTANISGTVILGMCWDLQHVPLGGVVGCQVLQGIQDGFCGCLTTVSTWVGELSTLRRRHAYTYGGLSITIALVLLVVIMGSMKWTIGFGELMCIH